MDSCKNCLNNNWKFKQMGEIVGSKKHRWVIATCDHCGDEVEFGHRVIERIIKEGQLCRRCGTPVIKKIPKKFNKKAKYHFHYYLFCPKCKQRYMLESQKFYGK